MTVTDAEGHVGTDALSVDVRNAAPVPSVNAPAIWVRGAPVALSAGVTDAGLEDTFEIAWDFGDGTGLAFAPLVDVAQLHPTHIWTEAGTYTVTFSVRDDDGGEALATAPVDVRRAAVLPDPGDPADDALFVGGSVGADSIFISPGWEGPGLVRVTMEGAVVGLFGPVVRVVAYGQGGADTIFISPNLFLPTQIHGGAGNDALSGGSGPDVLLGDAGSDNLVGRAGANVLIGGADADVIAGGWDQDLVIPGATDHDDDREALAAIAAEWARTDATLAERVEHLTTGGGVNGDALLAAATVHDDAVADAVDGGSGLDWLFVRVDEPDRDTAEPAEPGDIVTPLSPVAAAAPELTGSTSAAALAASDSPTVTLTPFASLRGATGAAGGARALRAIDLLPPALRSLTLGEVVEDPSRPWQPGFSGAAEAGVLPQIDETLTPALSG